MIVESLDEPAQSADHEFLASAQTIEPLKFENEHPVDYQAWYKETQMVASKLVHAEKRQRATEILLAKSWQSRHSTLVTSLKIFRNEQFIPNNSSELGLHDQISQWSQSMSRIQQHERSINESPGCKSTTNCYLSVHKVGGAVVTLVRHIFD